jgi:hypothetical protein
MDKSRAIQGLLMRFMRRKKTNIVKPFVGAAAEITMPMNFGLAVTSVKGGSMESA